MSCLLLFPFKQNQVLKLIIIHNESFWEKSLNECSLNHEMNPN